MSISSDIQTLNQLNAEIKRTRVILKNLREQAKNTEANIITYLKSKEQNGVKYQGKAIVLENRPKSTIRKKSEQELDSIDILESHGVNDPRRVLKELYGVKRGNPHEVEVLKFLPLKKN
jgi:hypothetical protein